MAAARSADTSHVRLVALLLAAASLAGCATTQGIARPSPFPMASHPEAVRPPLMEPTAGIAAEAVVRTALGFQGVPYRLGGDSPGTGFDCSGFVRYVFSTSQVDLPRTVIEQFSAGVHKIGRAHV